MLRIVVIIFATLLIASCSARVEYAPIANQFDPNAININTAPAEELERLPSIGPKTSEAIIQFRDENGPFRRVEHLMLVRGVSERRFAEIRPHLRTE
ncbi:MAG: helix-hairpin-helix domain-containing protein [Pyrinomonadaceae bacterium]